MTKTLLCKREGGMIKGAQQGAKDPRVAETTGGVTEGMSFDMHILPDYPQANPTFYGGI